MDVSGSRGSFTLECRIQSCMHDAEGGGEYIVFNVEKFQVSVGNERGFSRDDVANGRRRFLSSRAISFFILSSSSRRSYSSVEVFSLPFGRSRTVYCLRGDDAQSRRREDRSLR